MKTMRICKENAGSGYRAELAVDLPFAAPGVLGGGVLVHPYVNAEI